MKIVLLMLGVLTFMNQKILAEENKTEQILKVDIEFSQMSEEKGIKAAFEFYMADDAAILKNRMNPIVGRDAVSALFEKYTNDDKLIWKPLYAQMSKSEDLGYTYGKWTFSSPDSIGEVQESYGHYITIWEKQIDGSWKFVFDSGTSGIPDEE